MKRRVWLLVAALLFVLIPNVSAFDEFNFSDSRATLLFPETVLSDPIDPKVDCHPTGQHCLLLVYENNTFFGQGVKVWFTTDYFQTVFNRQQVASVSIVFTDNSSGFNTYHFPYDVSYVQSEGKYYYFVFNAVFSFDGATVTSLGNFEETIDPNKRYGLGFINKTHIRSFEVITATDSDSKTVFFLKGNVLGDGFSVRADWIDDTTNPTLRQAINFFDGSDAGAGTVSVSGCAAGVECDANISINIPTNFSGHDYFDDVSNEVGYQRNENSSWRVGTTDLSNFDNPAQSHAWNLSGINENINNTDSMTVSGNNRIWAYWRASNDTSVNGVWIFNLPITRVTIFGEAIDPARRSTEGVNLTATLNCSKENFVSTDSNIFAELQTPCTEDQVVTLTSFTARPTNFVFDNFTIPAGCVGLSNFIVTDPNSPYILPYDFSITYLDALFGTRVQGVSSNLDGVVLTSNSEGQVTYNDVFPVQNETFESTQVAASCSYILNFTGNAKPFGLIATRSGYDTHSETFFAATPPFNIETDFLTTKTVIINPQNTQIEVHLFSKDNVEIFPSSVVVNVTGSNATFVSINNELFNATVANTVPAKFILINNFGSFSMNVTVDYFERISEIINVTVGEFRTVNIFLNKSSWELPCVTDSDCTTDLCIGQFYKQFSSCINSECSYQTFDCGVPSKCDEKLGCVDLISTTNCTFDNQCNNSCIDGFNMLNNRCGINNFCKANTVECIDSCNATLGFCQEFSECIKRNEMELKVGYIRTSNSRFRGVSTNAFCDFSNAGKKTCGTTSSHIITLDELAEEGLNFNDVFAVPNNWQGLLNASQLEFYAMSVFCDQFCNMTFEFCEHGCDESTGECKGISTIVDDATTQASEFNDIFTAFFNWYMAVFSNIFARSVLWFIYGIFLTLFLHIARVSVIKTGVVANVGSEIDIIILLGWVFLGSVSGQFFEFVWVVITIISIFLLATWFINRQKQVAG